MISEANPTPPALPADPTSTPLPPAHATEGVRTHSHKGWIILSVVLAVILIPALSLLGWYWYNFHAGLYRPVTLTPPEQQVLEQKLTAATGEPVVIGEKTPGESGSPDGSPAAITIDSKSPGVFAAADNRTIILTEHELNGYLHHNTDLGERLKFDLRPNAFVVRLIQPIEPEVPVVGGKTLRVNVTLGAYIDPTTSRFRMEVDDISVGGVPIPNAWLGDIKNQDFFAGAEYGDGFLRRFADGIENFEIRNGEMLIRLAE